MKWWRDRTLVNPISPRAKMKNKRSIEVAKPIKFSNQRFIVVVLLALFASLSAMAQATPQRPNFIVILTDDLGYGDFGCYGATDVATPMIDQMAEEGLKLTSFYVSPVCSPTRAALMTGCYSQRVGVGGVMFERNPNGLNRDEETIPEILKGEGYATALIGKWHLGYQNDQHPPHHGFDYWFGTVASNNTKFTTANKTFAKDCVFREGLTRETVMEHELIGCSLFRNDEVIEAPTDQTQFTKRYTEETIRYINENKDKPFFIYLAHNMPHIPLYASEAFLGKSERGLYGDVIEELDWGIGEIFKALKANGLDENTFVILTSDNGPKKSAGGSSLNLRGGKGSSFEGGVRVPCLMRWPGKIPAGSVIDEPVAIFDILPTLTNLAGGEVPTDRVIDGQDVWPLVSGEEGAKSPHDAYYYLKGAGAKGVRVGNWKYITEAAPEDERKKVEVELTKEERALPRSERKALIKERSKELGSKTGPVEGLYDLSEDPGERNNLLKENPEVVEQLKQKLEAFGKEIRANSRPVGVSGDSNSQQAASPTPTAAPDVKKDTPKNVLLLAADDLNTWLLGDPNRYSGKIVAPNLLKLAGSGVNFTNAYTASPVCSPSRTAFFSGVSPWNSGHYHNALQVEKSEPLKNAISLAGFFKQAGYSTSGYGKITHGWDQKDGWEEKVGHKRDPAPPGAPLTPVGRGEQDWGPIHLPESEMNGTQMANFAIQKIQEKHDRPFFIACGLFNPHMPWYVPQKYFDMFPLDEIEVPVLKEGDLEDVPDRAKQLTSGKSKFTDSVMEHDLHKQAVQAYQATTAYADAQLGRVLDALDASPYKDDTIVVFLSDHGFHLGEKNHWQKATLWEEATHCLLMIRVPGMTKQGSVSKRFVSLQDIYPTLAELTGIAPLEYLDGRSLVPLLKNPDAEWESTAITGLCQKSHPDDAYLTIRNESGRYTRYGDGQEEFYHSKKDPREWTNEINNPEFTETIDKLKKALPNFSEIATPLPPVVRNKR